MLAHCGNFSGPHVRAPFLWRPLFGRICWTCLNPLLLSCILKPQLGGGAMPSELHNTAFNCKKTRLVKQSGSEIIATMLCGLWSVAVVRRRCNDILMTWRSRPVQTNRRNTTMSQCLLRKNTRNLLQFSNQYMQTQHTTVRMQHNSYVCTYCCTEHHTQSLEIISMSHNLQPRYDIGYMYIGSGMSS